MKTLYKLFAFVLLFVLAVACTEKANDVTPNGNTKVDGNKLTSPTTFAGDATTLGTKLPPY